MKRAEKNLIYTEKRRGRSLDATGAGPYIRLGLVLLALAVAVLAIVLLVVPLARGAVDWDAAFVRHTPAPASGGAETPAAPALISGRVQSLTLDAKNGEAVLMDASVAGGELVYASGASESACERIVRVNLETGRRRTVTPALENDSLRMPRANADYLVWFDAKTGGGGNIRVRSERTGEDTTLVQLNAGLPALYLDGRYLVFTVEAGIAAKLYAIDLESFESITLAVLADPAFAASAPAVSEGCVYYAGEGGLCAADLADGTAAVIDTGVAVHDPAAADGGVLWLSGNHGADTDLYYRGADGGTLILARGVVNAAAANGCAVYGRDGTVYAYLPAEDRFYMLSGAEEYAELVAAGGDYALWRVLSEEQALYRYLKVN